MVHHGLTNRVHHLLTVLCLLVVACTIPKGNQNYLYTTVTIYPAHPLTETSSAYVIVNTYDVDSKKYRDKKEAQFGELIELAKRHLASEMEKRGDIQVLVEDRHDWIKFDLDSLKRYMISLPATHAILINYFKAYFEQTEVVVTETETGKTKEAFYDLVVDIGYSLRHATKPGFDTLISVRKFHSSRLVLSGLLAAGPNIVSNHDEVVEGVLVNVENYLANYLPRTEQRTRILLTSNELYPVAEMLVLHDYEGILRISMEATQSTEPELAAKAYYNCAVISEYNQDYGNARHYLQESLRIFKIPEANIMWRDYRYQ